MQENIANQHEASDLSGEDTMRNKYLTFMVNGGEYGVEIRYVIDIQGIQAITPVPHTRHYIKGIINLRGTVIPVIDIRLRFGFDQIAYSDRTCIIILSLEEAKIGIVVDEVQEVTDIFDENVKAPPKTSGDSLKNNFVKAIGTSGKSVKQLLDIYKVFDME